MDGWAKLGGNPVCTPIKEMTGTYMHVHDILQSK